MNRSSVHSKRQYIRMRLLFMIAFATVCMTLSAQYYGMQFSAHDFVLDQRSGLILTPEGAHDLKRNLDLQFQLRLDPKHETYFGYIFRLIIGNRNIDLIHSIVPGNPNNFELILGDKTSKIAFHIPIEKLQKNWIKFSFELDFKNHQVSCFINDQVLVDELYGFDENEGFRLIFGANSFGNFSSTDVPAMILRDVELICDEGSSCKWPLNETDGNIAHSVPEGDNGIAINPRWLLKEHNTWMQLLELEIKGEVKSTFDPRNDDLYILSMDSLYIYNLIEDGIRGIAQESPPPIEGSNQLIFDTISNRLLLYSLGNHYLSSFNFETRKWSPSFPGKLEETNYWQHNHFVSPDGTIMAFGGYGQYMYKNSMLAWNPEMKHFDSLAYKGNFHPR